MSGGKKILLVDDDPDLLALVTKLLKDNSYDVDPAYNGAQAKYKIENESYDLIISDIHMPLLNGLEFIKAIKFRSSRFEHTPVVVISGHVTEEMKKSLGKIGVESIYEKPVNYKDLVSQISSLLN